MGLPHPEGYPDTPRCSMCGGMTDRQGDAMDAGERAESREILHHLWQLCHDSPDDLYILLARLLGKLSFREISEKLSCRVAAPSKVAVQKRCCGLAVIYPELHSHLGHLASYQARGKIAMRRAALAAMGAHARTIIYKCPACYWEVRESDQKAPKCALCEMPMVPR